MDPVWFGVASEAIFYGCPGRLVVIVHLLSCLEFNKLLLEQVQA